MERNIKINKVTIQAKDGKYTVSYDWPGRTRDMTGDLVSLEEAMKEIYKKLSIPKRKIDGDEYSGWNTKFGVDSNPQILDINGGWIASTENEDLAILFSYSADTMHDIIDIVNYFVAPLVTENWLSELHEIVVRLRSRIIESGFGCDIEDKEECNES